MIRIKNLSFNYEKTVVLDRVSMDFSNTGVYGILGPNGAGKSTLLKLIGGILKTPKNHIFIDEVDLTTINRKDIATKIAYVPQQFSPTYAFTVEAMLSMGRHPYHGQFEILSQEEHKMIDYAIEVTGLGHLRRSYITELSGGELQRVMIARALVQDTSIIILDEPISHLDIHYQKEIIRLLNQIAKDKNKLIITVLHDMNVGLNHCDYIHLLFNHKVLSGKPSEVLTIDIVSNVYKTEVRKIEDKSGNFIHW